MDIILSKDFFSVQPFIAKTPILGSNYYARGSGFIPLTAIAKAYSEKVEREYEKSLPMNQNILAIAAHTKKENAQENAKNELLEELMVKKIKTVKLFSGMVINIGGVKIRLARLNNRWFSLMQFKLRGQVSMTSSVRVTLIQCLLSSWTEARELMISKPRDFRVFTRPNKHLFENNKIIFKDSDEIRKCNIEIKNFKLLTKEMNNRFIAYYL